MYIPKWVPISEAVGHVRAAQGLNWPDAEHLLVVALRDGDVRAREADTGKPIQQERWRPVASNPVHMPSLIPIEISVEDLLRHWPENAHAAQPIRADTMSRSVVPALILANKALSETIQFLRKTDSLRRRDLGRTIREELDHAASLNLTELAIECLRTACAAHNLTMLVVDPGTLLCHEVPAEYFDQRAFAGLEFASAFFRGCERSELIAADPLFKLVLPFRGWVHGFDEANFRAWLEDLGVGPLAGPTMRPFFHIDPHESVASSDTAKSTAPPGRRGRKPGSGSIDDTEQIFVMLHLLAAGEARSVHDAAGKAAGTKAGSRQSDEAVIARLRRKFTNAYGTQPPSGQTWREVAHNCTRNDALRYCTRLQ